MSGSDPLDELLRLAVPLAGPASRVLARAGGMLAARDSWGSGTGRLAIKKWPRFCPGCSLNLLCDWVAVACWPEDVEAARQALESGDACARARAADYLDNPLLRAVRRHAVPVLELSVEEEDEKETRPG